METEEGKCDRSSCMYPLIKVYWLPRKCFFTSEVFSGTIKTTIDGRLLNIIIETVQNSRPTLNSQFFSSKVFLDNPSITDFLKANCSRIFQFTATIFSTKG